jgi:hypothetical protein
MAFFQRQIGQAQLRHQLLQPLILLAQLTDFLRGRLSLRVPAHPPFAGLHEVLQPLVVDRGVNPLAPAQLRDRDLSPDPFQHDADLLLGGKLASGNLPGAADHGAPPPPPGRGSLLPLWQDLHSWFTPLVYRAV